MVSWKTLRKRKLVQWAAAYAAVAWVTLQVLSLIGQQFDWSPLLLRLLTVALGIGFVVTVVVAWYHGDRGEQRVTGSEVAILLVTLSLGGGLMWRTAHVPRAAAASPAAASALAAIPDITTDPSIAVLPFLDLSQAHDQEYFSDGISEELLTLLARIPKLRVIARTSSFSFRGKEVAIPDIARALHVAAILEGSVRKSGDAVRVTVQLVRATDSAQLWSETYDRPLGDIFKVQDEIAATVAAKLRITLLGAAPTVRPVDPRVYPLILQAKALADQNDGAARTRAAALYKQALKVAPDEARAWSGLGRIYPLLPEGSREAKKALQRALALDPTDALSYSRLAMIEEAGGHYDAAIRNHQLAMALGPANVNVLGNAAYTLEHFGQLDDAIALNTFCAAHDPANPSMFASLGINQYFAGRWDQAIASTRTALSLSPTYAGAHMTIGEVLLLGKRDAKAALAEMQVEPSPDFHRVGVAIVLSALHRDADANAALAEVVAEEGKYWPEGVAMVYAARGDADHAFEWLDKAAADRDAPPTLTAVEPMFASLHHDARWLPFLRAIGKAPEQLARLDFKVNLPR